MLQNSTCGVWQHYFYHKSDVLGPQKMITCEVYNASLTQVTWHILQFIGHSAQILLLYKK